MATSICFHFFGNELARAASVSLISTKEIGLGSSALTYTVLFGFPASALTLYLYTSSIKYYGTTSTFRLSCLICLTIFIGMTYATSTDILRHKNIISQVIVVAFYAFREIYSTLLSTQQWAFIVSALDHTTASYIVTFSGVVSIISTLGGISVEHVVTAGGVKGLLSVSSLSVLLTIVSSEIAFWSHTPKSTSSGDKSEKDKHKHKERSATVDDLHATPSSNSNKPDNNNNNNSAANNAHSSNKQERVPKPETGSEKKVGFSMWNDSMRLLTNSTLQLLVIEAVVHQSCSNMLNIMFYDGLRHVVTVDDTRAVLVGRFFATVNFSSCLLQFFVVPYVLTQKTLPTVMMYIPILVCLCTALCSVAPSLLSVMLSFGVLKVLEYAVLAGAMEMIYMPLDSETRYLGKEYVRFFGSKVGKTGASLALTTLTAHIRPSLTTKCVWSLSLALAWAGVMTFLSAHLSDKISAAESAHTNRDGNAKETMPVSRVVSESNLSTTQESSSSIAQETEKETVEVERVHKSIPVPHIGSMFSIAWDDMSSVSRKRSRTMSVCDADYSFMFSPADILGALSEEDADTSDESEPSETPRRGADNPVNSVSMRKRSTSSHSFPNENNDITGPPDLTTALSGNNLIPSPRRALLRSLRRSRKRSVFPPRARSRSEPLMATDNDDQSFSSSQRLELDGSMRNLLSSIGAATTTTASPRAKSSTIPRSVSGILKMSHEDHDRTAEPILFNVPRSYEEYQKLFGDLDGSSFCGSYKAPSISFSEFSNLVVGMESESESRGRGLDSESSVADDQNGLEAADRQHSSVHVCKDGIDDIAQASSSSSASSPSSSTTATAIPNGYIEEASMVTSANQKEEECIYLPDADADDKSKSTGD